MHTAAKAFQAPGCDPGPRTTPSPGRAARVEVAKARVRAAGLRGDPVAAEAATRAYVAAANLALLADLRGLMLDRLRTVWRRLGGRRRTSAAATEGEP